MLAQPPLAIEAFALSDAQFVASASAQADACADSNQPRTSGKARAIHREEDGVGTFLQDFSIL